MNAGLAVASAEGARAFCGLSSQAVVGDDTGAFRLDGVGVANLFRLLVIVAQKMRLTAELRGQNWKSASC